MKIRKKFCWTFVSRYKNCSDKKIFTRQEQYEVSKDGQSRQIYNKNANTEIFEEKRLKIQDLQ